MKIEERIQQIKEVYGVDLYVLASKMDIDFHQIETSGSSLEQAEVSSLLSGFDIFAHPVSADTITRSIITYVKQCGIQEEELSRITQIDLCDIKAFMAEEEVSMECRYQLLAQLYRFSNLLVPFLHMMQTLKQRTK